MTREFEKGMRILSNLLSFCGSLGGACFHMDMKNVERCLSIEIRTELEKINSAQIERLQEALEAPRQHEMEEYYWELIGEFDANDELSLVGMMVDRAEVWHEGGELYIRVERNY